MAELDMAKEADHVTCNKFVDSRHQYQGQSMQWNFSVKWLFIETINLLIINVLIKL